MLRKIDGTSSILSISADFSSETDENVAVAVTAIVGPNGSRKSLLLQMICEDALGRNRLKRSRSPIMKLESEWTAPRPRKLICVSSTVMDRFPHPRHMALKEPCPEYVYFGPKNSRSIQAVRAQDRMLVQTLLRNRTLKSTESSSFEAAFHAIGLKPEVYVYLRPSAGPGDSLLRVMLGSITEANVERALKKAIKSQILPTNTPEKLVHADYLRSILIGEDKEKIVADITRLLESTSAPIKIQGTRVLKHVKGPPLKVWEALIALQILDITRTEFVKASPTQVKRIPSTELSSGQWGWLVSFCGIFSEVSNRTLILIDEPENSLHPEWQRNYMTALLDGIQNKKYCQVIVATHSPFIAAGLPPTHGSVLRLEANEKSETTTVTSIPIGNLHGWKASDVYDHAFDLSSTRDEAFIQAANHALSLIRDRKPLRNHEARRIQQHLLDIRGRLPADDKMRIILENVAREIASLES